MSFRGRNTQNKVVVFPKLAGLKPGDYVQVEILDTTSATLIGKIV
jgi:tRNA-2-methylthio-N6-dimethylallyladenosine synthase